MQGNGAQRLIEALEAAGVEPTPVTVPSGAAAACWGEPVVGDEDGFDKDLNLSDGAKRDDSLELARERDRQAEEAAAAGDRDHVVWARSQAARERANAAKFAMRVCRGRARLPKHGPRDGIGRRTHGTRRRAGAAGSRRTSRGSPSDDPHPDEGDDPEHRPPELLLTDVGQYLTRLGSDGAERDWLVDQVAFLGYPPERVGAALALLGSEGLARRGRGDGNTDVIWGQR